MTCSAATPIDAAAQLEFIHLSELSGVAKYGKAAAAVIEVLHDKFPNQVAVFLHGSTLDEGGNACS